MYVAPDKVPLVVYDLKSGKKIGMYNLIAINPSNRCLELGGLWFAPSFQRTFANTEASRLVLEYCFETINCRRVEWKTHHKNVRSQNAATRLGFQFEGRFRNHMISHGNRDTMWYSIIDSDWPLVKQRFPSQAPAHPVRQ
jgi:RimJ/RimL family protein N-acetyltransferase